VKFEPNEQAFFHIRSVLARPLVESTAARIAGSFGAGYGWSSRQGQKRWRASVYPKTWAARMDNATNNTMVRRFGSG